MEHEHLSFNLIDKPWIRVRMIDRTIRELSIREVLTSASEIEGLRNDNAAQDFAILRILLAIIQRSLVPRVEEELDAAFENDDEEPGPVELWVNLWREQSLPMKEIDAYLNKWHWRFDLFDPEVPFMQVAGLEATNGKITKISKIIADVPDGHQFFTTRIVNNDTAITIPEAARWLIHVQAFDTAGNKTGVVGDPNVKGGKSYSFGVPAWAGTLGCLYFTGDCLRKTLLLNLVLWGNSPFEMFALDDLPSWEREQDGPTGIQREPTGRIDLYTWQSRRVRLIARDATVSGVILTNGNKLEPQNRETVEPMSGWKRSNNQEKKGSSVVSVGEIPA